MTIRTVVSRVSRFRRDEDGAVTTLDTVLWLPFFFMLLVMAADTSVVFMNKARIDRVVQDGHRALAVGRLADCDALETWLETTLGAMAPGVTAVCTTGASRTVTRISAPVNELDLTGATGILAGLTLRVESVHHGERGS